ncbi:MAG: two-component regulator propeller domain-containing protein, partial [Ferruginibacter sp.]
MLQDKEGFIWIATKGGLNTYDGYTFKTFTTDPEDSNSICSNSVSNLLEDSKGRIWIGTYDGGLSVYNKKTGRFLRITHKAGSLSGLSGNRIVSAMTELSDGRILVCPEGASMNIISLPVNANNEPVVTRLNVPGNRKALGIGKDDKGYIWVGCTDASIFIYTPSSNTFEMLTDGLTFTGLIEKTGTRLSARSSQAFFLKPIPSHAIAFLDSTGMLHPGAITFGAGGNMMINNRIPFNTGALGSVLYDFSSLKRGARLNDAVGYNLQTPAKNHQIKCMLLDRSGILWVGMLGEGLYKYRIGSNRFQPILSNLSIQRITILDNDIIYVHGWLDIKSLTGEGLACDNPLKRAVQNSVSTDVLQAQNGEYWAYGLQQKKLFRYSAGFKLMATYGDPVNSTPTEQLQPLIEDSRHNIWVCGANGTLASIDPATGKLSRFVIDVEQNTGTAALAQTTAFYEDRAGVFWLGTEHGFAKLVFTNDTAAPEVVWFKNIPGNSNSLSYNYVSWFMDDPVNPDYLWISTKGGGLNRMEKSTGKFFHYTTRQGLPNDVVYGTLTDNAGNIWGSTNRGLFCMLTGSSKDAAKSAIRVFSTTDGLQADEFNTNAFGKLSNGDLVFGGVNGINIFNPQKVLVTSFTPNVFITGIQIGNTVLAPGDKTGVLRETIEQTHSITLDYLQDVVTLEFSSLDFTAPQQNKYRYQLIGIDK